jgi:hypothetical protein
MRSAEALTALKAVNIGQKVGQNIGLETGLFLLSIRSPQTPFTLC